MLREGLKLARKIGQTPPLSSAILSEVSPGASVQSDDDWDAFAAQNFGTEFHPSCSCAMLPLEQGGVVDANLKVYGLANVRVADASVYPIQFAAHVSRVHPHIAFVLHAHCRRHPAPNPDVRPRRTGGEHHPRAVQRRLAHPAELGVAPEPHVDPTAPHHLRKR